MKKAIELTPMQTRNNDRSETLSEWVKAAGRLRIKGRLYVWNHQTNQPEEVYEPQRTR